MKANNAKKILELVAGHGRDTIFFVSDRITEEVEALNYSGIAVEILDKITKELSYARYTSLLFSRMLMLNNSKQKSRV
jgi:hypothetical protein